MITLILPYYKPSERLILNLNLIQSFKGMPQISEVIVSKNGSDSLSKHDLAIKSEIQKLGFMFFYTKEKGIGAGYAQAIRNAKSDFLLLSADDLPFNFSDINNVGPLDLQTIYIGSKAHKESIVVGLPFLRKFISLVFYFLRLCLFGIGTPKDSQGTIFVPRFVALDFVNSYQWDNGFLFSTELIEWSRKKNYLLKEIPIEYIVNKNEKTRVLFLQSTFLMLMGLIKLRWRLFFD